MMGCLIGKTRSAQKWDVSVDVKAGQLRGDIATQQSAAMIALQQRYVAVHRQTRFSPRVRAPHREKNPGSSDVYGGATLSGLAGARRIAGPRWFALRHDAVISADTLARARHCLTGQPTGVWIDDPQGPPVLYAQHG
jgi:hypothetical protein